ncbi:hypothetical protein V5O48_010694 [Marasmius crinis-equi]|uniref:Uncharacterized protein n=1 Tax=Marasmius crinis-equi TaxID=585013 RepID=A0ABR3F7L7_9AGAR
MQPKEIEAQLSAMAMNDTVQDPPLLKLAESACSYIVSLRQQNPSHTTDQKGYDGFYNVVTDIVKHFQLQTTEDPTTRNRSAKKAHKRRTADLKSSLKHEYKRASQVELFKREDALLVVANIVKTIGDAPGLAPLKLAGGCWVKSVIQSRHTIQSNKAECTSILDHAASILDDLARKMEPSTHKPAEDMKDDIRAFERTLVRVRDHIVKLQGEKGWRRVGRFVFAHKTKEELASLRKELERAQLTFVTRSIVATDSTNEGWVFWCDCPTRCKRLKTISRRAWDDHRKLRTEESKAYITRNGEPVEDNQRRKRKRTEAPAGNNSSGYTGGLEHGGAGPSVVLSTESASDPYREVTNTSTSNAFP